MRIDQLPIANDMARSDEPADAVSAALTAYESLIFAGHQRLALPDEVARAWAAAYLAPALAQGRSGLTTFTERHGDDAYLFEDLRDFMAQSGHDELAARLSPLLNRLADLPTALYAPKEVAHLKQWLGATDMPQLLKKYLLESGGITPVSPSVYKQQMKLLRLVYPERLHANLVKDLREQNDPVLMLALDWLNEHGILLRDYLGPRVNLPLERGKARTRHEQDFDTDHGPTRISARLGRLRGRIKISKITESGEQTETIYSSGWIPVPKWYLSLYRLPLFRKLVWRNRPTREEDA